MMQPYDLYSTYSIAACDLDAGELGAAVQTHQIGVGSRILWLEPGVGALVTQSLANIGFGPVGLAMLAEGVAPKSVIAGLVGSDPNADRRQLGLVNAQGQAAAFSGARCIAYAGHHVGAGYAVQANLMTRPTVIEAMRDAFETTTGDLASRMLAAMDAAQAEDGDLRGSQSAAIKVVPNRLGVPEAQRYVVDLRVDEHAMPLLELRRLVKMRRAFLVDNKGFAAFAEGDKAGALALWEQARAMSPEQEELPYWQAVKLAEFGDLDTAATIMRLALTNEPRRAEWIDLLYRLDAIGLVGAPGNGAALAKRVE
ncbi:MAG: DUF1028 domain-containing protein [Anaerolineae bacterium]|nr:DUF1028 domain-containing protein [Anaerolineae bacterium]